MRFTVAAAWLANSVAASSSSKFAELGRTETKSVNYDGQNRRLLGPKRRSFRLHDGETPFPLLEGSLFKTIAKHRPLNDMASGLLTTSSYGLTGERAELVECDPDADVGVLSCGNEQYCVESTESVLGGVCADNTHGLQTDNVETFGRRRLQAIGNQTILELATALCNTTEFEYYTCNCSLDYAASSGSFSCVGEERCGLMRNGCYDSETFQYCLSGTISGSLEGPNTYSYKTCYTQNMTASAYVFEYCAHVSFDAVNGPSCEMEVGGVKCNSCAVAVNGGATYDENCEIFDCTNTKIEFAGDRCDAIATPTLLIEAEFNYLYQEHWPCEDGCNLCGVNGYMTKGKKSFNYTSQLLSGAKTLYCYDIMYEAMIGGLYGTSYCESLPSLAKEPCGCVSSPAEQPSSPPVEDADPPTVTPVEGEPGNSVSPPTTTAGGSSLSGTTTTIAQFGGMILAIWSVLVG